MRNQRLAPFYREFIRKISEKLGPILRSGRRRFVAHLSGSRRLPVWDSSITCPGLVDRPINSLIRQPNRAGERRKG
jgi:hypothetical protein